MRFGGSGDVNGGGGNDDGDNVQRFFFPVGNRGKGLGGGRGDTYLLLASVV